MVTVLDLITEALVTVKALAVGEPARPDMTTDALNRFNEVVDSLSIQNLAVYSIIQTTFPLVAGQAVYTIGPTGGIVAPRPPFLTTGFVTQQLIDWPVDMTRTADEYAALALKSQPGVPEWGIYNPTFPNGTITLYPVPYLPSTMTINQNRAFTPATTLLDQFDMPPGYRRTIRLLLAWDLVSDYPGMTPAEIEKLKIDASGALALIKRNNKKPELMASEVAKLDCSGGGNYGNWRNGA